MILSICIASYNRVYELKRSLNSIFTNKFNSDIEVIISEDSSPKKLDIINLVADFSKTSKLNILLNSNEINLGFDKNLKKLISLAKGKYILLLSDDDYIIPGTLDKIISVLKSEEFGVGFLPFYDNHQKTILTRKLGNKNFKISPKLYNAKKYLFNSILFSGLIFNRDLILSVDADRFYNFNYFQVYLYLFSITKMGGLYINIPSIIAPGDGENGFGKNDKKNLNPLLANRNSIYSNTEFHKGLINTIKTFDIDQNTDILKSFSIQYSIRLLDRLCSAAEESKNDLNKYWRIVNGLGIKIHFQARIYYFLIKTFGPKITKLIFLIPKKLYFTLNGWKLRLK